MTHVRSFLLLGLSALLLGSAASWAARLAELDRQWGKLTELPGFLREERLRRERLERWQEVLRRRGAAKDQLLHDLLDGHTTLLEAAARLRQIDLACEGPCRFPLAYPGRSEGERRCRQVIACVGNLLHYAEPRPDAEEILRRLEDELAGHLYCHGTVALPLVD